MALAATLTPNPLDAFLYFESGLRSQYLRLDSSAVELQSQRALIQKSAYFLEVLLVGAFIHEVLGETGVKFSDVTPEIAKDLHARTLAMCGLDLEEVMQNALTHLRFKDSKGPEFTLSREAVVRAMKSALEIWPIDHLEQVAAEQGMETWGHRCRVAYDGIRAFKFLRIPRTSALRYRLSATPMLRGRFQSPTSPRSWIFIRLMLWRF